MDQNFVDGTAALPSNGVTRDQLIKWVQHQQHAPGTMAKAMEDMTTPGVVEVTSATSGAKAVAAAAVGAAGKAMLAQTTADGVRAAYSDAETLNASGAASVGTSVTVLYAASGTWTVTLAAGLYTGQRKLIVARTTGSAAWTVTGTFAGFTQARLGVYGEQVGYSLLVEWDGSQWQWVGGNATLE